MINLTKDERDEFEKMANEIDAKVAAIKELFGPETRNFMLFLGAMSILNRDYASAAKSTPEEMSERIKEWIVVGMPEAFTGKWMAEQLIDRVMRDREGQAN